MSSIFEASGVDEIYCALKEQVNNRCQESKKIVEILWEKVKNYLDPDIVIELPNQFHPRFWEIYLAASLLEAGLELIPSSGRDGPDICIKTAQSKVWVEAVTASSGQGKDSVPEVEVGKVIDIPDDQIKLRLLNSFSEKSRKYKKYIDKKWISFEEPYIIAINAAQVPFARHEREIPRIIRVLLPIGYEVLHLEGNPLKLSKSSYEYQGVVLKHSGAEIETTSFLNQENSGISAVVYSGVDAFNHPYEISKAILLFHNPLALNPIPLGFTKRGYEYWLQNGHLMRKDWNQLHSFE